MSTPVTAVAAGSSDLPAIRVADGTLEAMKWLALILMTVDHINKFLFDEKLPYIFGTARIVMPIFGFVLAYNLARPGALERGAYKRTMSRLGWFALAATPFFMALNGNWWPLNVLWMLLFSTVVCYALASTDRRLHGLAVVAFVVGGALAEFWWFGILFCVGAWMYCRRPSWTALMVWLAGTVSLTVANQHWAAVCALPLIALAPQITLRVPRLRWAFYGYYPAHLLMLLLFVELSGR